MIRREAAEPDLFLESSWVQLSATSNEGSKLDKHCPLIIESVVDF